MTNSEVKPLVLPSKSKKSKTGSTTMNESEEEAPDECNNNSNITINIHRDYISFAAMWGRRESCDLVIYS